MSLDTCHWLQLDKEGFLFETSCGFLFDVHENNPSNSFQKYCCFCNNDITFFKFKVSIDQNDGQD